jgi:hypothetical protein
LHSDTSVEALDMAYLSSSLIISISLGPML